MKTGRQADRQTQIDSSRSRVDKDSSSILLWKNNPSSTYGHYSNCDQKLEKDYFLSKDNNIPSLSKALNSQKEELKMDTMYKTTILNQEDIKNQWQDNVIMPYNDRKDKRTEQEIDNAIESIINTKPVIENTELVKKPINDVFTALYSSVNSNIPQVNYNDFQTLFNDVRYRTSFIMLYCGKKVIATSLPAKITGKTTLRSYDTINEEGEKRVITIKRTEKKDGLPNYDIFTALDENDRLVMVQSQLGKRTPVKSYDEEKEQLEKSLNNYLDKMTKFTESHSRVNFLDKNMKTLRGIKKDGIKLIGLIDSSR